MDSPRVSVVIPVHQDGAAFRRCLAALAAARPQPHEIVIACDGPVADVDAAVAALHEAREIRLPERGGPARARNAGARAAAGDVVLFLDSDVEVRPDVIARVEAILGAADAPTACFGSYDDEPAAPGLLSQYRNLLHHFTHQRSEGEATTFWAGCGAIRRDAFLAIGGFDESYARPSIEDIELGRRLHRAGARIRLAHDLQVKHLKRWSAAGMLRTDVLDRAWPWSRLIVREGHLPRDLNLRPSARLSGMAALALGACAPGAIWSVELVAGALAAGFALVALNAPFYRFLATRRGPAFAFASAPWHWLYYATSSLAFAAAVGERLWRGRPAA